jgi:hypothetical protein
LIRQKTRRTKKKYQGQRQGCFKQKKTQFNDCQSSFAHSFVQYTSKASAIAITVPSKGSDIRNTAKPVGGGTGSQKQKKVPQLDRTKRKASSTKFRLDRSKPKPPGDLNDVTTPQISSLQPLNLTIMTDYLGVLLDAGHHYFQMDWIKRTIDMLSCLYFDVKCNVRAKQSSPRRNSGIT